jgi:hypothetical protein
MGEKRKKETPAMKLAGSKRALRYIDSCFTLKQDKNIQV